jgi:16S rRNA (guanine527-N7)-methyltransferase
MEDLLAALSAKYGLAPSTTNALAKFVALTLDPNLDALESRPSSQTLVANRIANSVAAIELEQVRTTSRMADIGSGLGFPGLVLAAVKPRASVWLVEKEARRCEFLLRAIDEMGLTNVDVVHTRIQDWSDGSESVELVTARSVGRPSGVVRFAAPLLTIGGSVVIWGNVKRDTEKEADAETVAKALGLRPAGVVLTAPPTTASRHLHVYEKIAPTPSDRLSEPKVVRPSWIRQERKRARKSAAVATHDKAVERLERAYERVRALEAAQAGPDDADATASDGELERARAVVRKMQARVEVLKRRRVRAERKLEPPALGRGDYK